MSLLVIYIQEPNSSSGNTNETSYEPVMNLLKVFDTSNLSEKNIDNFVIRIKAQGTQNKSRIQDKNTSRQRVRSGSECDKKKR